MMHSACCVLPKELREDLQGRRKWRVPRFSRLKNRYDSLTEEIAADDDEKERSWSSSFLRPDPASGREAELEAEPELLDSSASTTASGDFSASCWAEVDFEHNGVVQLRRTVSSSSAPPSIPSGTAFIADQNASAGSPRSVATGEEESFGLESKALDDISLLRPFRRLRFADEVDGEQLEEVHEMILIEHEKKRRRLRPVRRRIEI